MKQAEKFHRPIITFIDTPGAYPGKDAEERGQGEAIARNLMEMSGLTVPVLAIVTGEGSSGGALGLGVANHILMLENAVYSVLSPRGLPVFCGRCFPQRRGLHHDEADGTGPVRRWHCGRSHPRTAGAAHSVDGSCFSAGWTLPLRCTLPPYVR